MKILLVNLPSTPMKDGEFPNQLDSMPLGIMYLSAYIKKFTDAEVRMLDINETVNLNYVPDIIGYSIIFSTSHQWFVQMVPQLKEIFPNALHIAGGTHATSAYEEVGKYVDHVFLGEGEEKLIDCIKNGFKEKYIKCEMTDIEKLPFPDYEIIDMERYTSGNNRSMVDNKKSATVQASRGCPYKCTFCAAHTVHGRKMRLRKVEDVVAEIKYLYDTYQVNLIIIEDDLFLAPKKRGLELLKKIRELKIPDFEMRFPSAFAVKILDEELIDSLIKSGTDVFNIAIESGSKKTQKAIKKNVPLDKAKRLVKYIRQQKTKDHKPVLARVYFMLGFPGETREDMNKTIQYAISLKADWCRFACAVPLIGSSMYGEMLPYLPDNQWQNSHFSIRPFDTPEISGRELTALVRECHNHVNYLNSPYFSESKFERGLACLLEYSKIHTNQVVQVTFTCIDGELSYKSGVKKIGDI